jgi:hypothetical protein
MSKEDSMEEVLLFLDLRCKKHWILNKIYHCNLNESSNFHSISWSSFLNQWHTLQLVHLKNVTMNNVL